MLGLPDNQIVVGGAGRALLKGSSQLRKGLTRQPEGSEQSQVDRALLRGSSQHWEAGLAAGGRAYWAARR